MTTKRKIMLTPRRSRFSLPLGNHTIAMVAWSVVFLCFLIESVHSLPVRREPSLCIRDGQMIWNLLVFLTTNYASHAATVPGIPGGKWHDHLLLNLIALFLPFAGLGRSVSLVLDRILLGRHQLYQAWAGRALAFVCRKADWEPPEGREDVVFAQLPIGYHDIDETVAEASYASFNILPVRKDNEVNPYDEADVLSGCDIHGTMSLPAGYGWATLERDYFYAITKQTLQDPEKIRIARSQSYLKMVISVIQVLFASYTLYDTRGDQIDRYGYAAYGLTVIPYVIMSVVNLVAVGLVADYPCLYVVRTSILEEAASRPGALFDGVIGTLKSPATEAAYTDITPTPHSTSPAPHLDSDNQRSGSISDAEDDVKEKLLPDDEPSQNDSKPKSASPEGESVTAPGGQEMQAYVKTWMSIESRTDSEKPIRFLVVRTDGTTKRFRFAPAQDVGDSRVCQFNIGAVTNEYIPIPDDDGDLTGSDWIEVTFAIFYLFLVFALPYILIYALTRFRPGHSTPTQRARMLAWLCCSQVIFVPFWVFSRGDMGDVGFPAVLRRPKFLLMMALFFVGPVFGYTTVIQMYLKENYSQVPVCI
ncbi:hypothetical protein WOLCODRAFT_153255 [Wolfiporia cocos MD-104 SS10]|uniref:Uncharacterized protein n=1 Tax=Wolfiporia cocos (strain MD-104) TaxID=742152 RepID=A0A2H3JTA5_WOLCO|nr:hypothetical protein WOLCODRAFT_153255 [Wolfiporia cocos MD-104 SS10]